MNHCKEGTCRAGNLTELLRIEVTLTANTTVGNQSLTVLASLREFTVALRPNPEPVNPRSNALWAQTARSQLCAVAQPLTATTKLSSQLAPPHQRPRVRRLGSSELAPSGQRFSQQEGPAGRWRGSASSSRCQEAPGQAAGGAGWPPATGHPRPMALGCHKEPCPWPC